MTAQQQQQCLSASCMPLAYLVEPERRGRKPKGMEVFSESACFHRLRSLFWCIAEPQMAAFLTPEQTAALIEFERVYQSLPWLLVDGHPHISELPGDDLSPLLPACERLYRLIAPICVPDPAASADREGRPFRAERAEPYYPRDTQPLIAFTLPHADVVARFGPAHRAMDADDNEPGPCEYWSFRFPCGLVTFITYHFHVPTGPGGDVTASSPDIAHILQHLPISDCLFWRLDHAAPEYFHERYPVVSGCCPLRASNDAQYG